MSTEFSFTVQGDSEGYITFECPFCGSEFKLRADEYQNEEEPFNDLFCPYCGLAKSKDDFYSKEIIEKAEALAYNYFIDEVNKTFNNMKKSFNKPHSTVKIDYKPLKRLNIKDVNEKDTIETPFECNDCSRHFKILYSLGITKAFCPYCGVDL